jgi:hypothetical protein
MRLFRRRLRPGRVLLPVGGHLNPIVDELALSFHASPVTVTRLLAALADAVLALDAVVIDPYAEDWQISMAAELVDATRAALLGESITAEGSLDMDLSPDDADVLATRLTACAAAARLNSKDPR